MPRLKARRDENFSCWIFKNFGISEACLAFSKLLVLNFLAIRFSFDCFKFSPFDNKICKIFLKYI